MENLQFPRIKNMFTTYNSNNMHKVVAEQNYVAIFERKILKIKKIELD